MPAPYSNESLTNEMSPSAEALETLSTRTKMWLEVNGVYFEEIPSLQELEDGNRGALHEGLPISDGLPRKEFAAPGDVVRRFAPQASETLELGDKFSLIHWLPHYAPLVTYAEGIPTGEYELKDSSVTYDIYKRPDSTLELDSLIIEFDEENQKWVTDRMSESAMPLTMDSLSEEEQAAFFSIEDKMLAALAVHAAGYVFAKRMGTNLMTRREFSAISDIVHKLDDIKAAVDQAGA